MEEKGGGLSPWQKVAVLMVALGEEPAGELMRHLEEEEIEQLIQAIADLKNVPAALQNEVLAEFEEQLRRGEGTAGGGVAFARRLLEKALGPEQAEAFLERIGQQKGEGFRLLGRADPDQVASLVAGEHPQTIALILSQLEPTHAASVLERLPSSLQGEVAHRIATLERIPPGILQEVEAGLADMLGGLQGGKSKVGGPEVVAEILNQAGSGLESRILERVEAVDPDTAERIRDRMLVFDDLAHLDDREIQLVLRQIDPQDLLIALRGSGKGVRDRFLSAMSKRRRARFLEDMEAMPPVRLSEVEEAQARIARQVRRMVEQKEIRPPREEKEDPYVF